jgi:hypothetical protein
MKAYSDWLRVDLHIHTDKSKDTKDNDYKGVFSIDTLKSNLIKAEVGIFSLTDHNIINIDAYEEYYKNKNDEDPLLLLGVELDIELDNKGTKKRYHSLLVFNHSDIESVKKISESLENKYTQKSITDPKQRVLNIAEIVEIFDKEDFFFIPHAYGDKSIVTAHKESIVEAQKMVLLMPSALEKITKEEIIRHYNEGFDRLMNNEFKNQRDIAYINFSDNHNCDKYPCKHMGGTGDHSFYYIKGSKNYESLRLAFVDPESRIKSPTEYDSIDRTINYIEGFRIGDESGSNLIGGSFECSPHLNVIIGGRSSGKSLLMWLLGHKLDGVPISDKYKFNHGQVSIKLQSDSGYKEKSTLNHPILYLNQGVITNYFENKNLEELAKNTTHAEKYSSLKKEITETKGSLATSLEKLCEAYKKAHDNYSSQTMYVLASATISDALNEGIVVKFDDGTLSQQLQTGDIDFKIELLTSTVDNLGRIKNLSDLTFSIEENDYIDRAISVLNSKKENLSHLKNTLTKASRLVQLVKGKIKDINYTAGEDATKKTKATEQINALRVMIKERLMLMKKLRDASQSMTQQNYEQKKVIQLDEEVSLVLEVKKKQEIADLLLEGILHNDITKSLYLNLVKLVSGKINLKNYGNNTPDSFDKKMKAHLNVVLDLFDTPTDYLEYSDGENSKGKSPGYNSEQYLKIILANENFKTIFIDQPEDNLGNHFISQELVKLIRDIKFRKQIFLVTHNPSIVVYGDAECVILAENNDNKIQYKQLVIEDVDAQKIICDTLDGGKYIFNNRAEKYNIKRLKN